jgi:HEAT repeat protein
MMKNKGTIKAAPITMPYNREKTMNRKCGFPRRTGFLGSIVVVLLLSPVQLPAQEAFVLLSYERNFIRANLADKAGILQDAATDEQAGEFMGALYEFALDFALRHADILREDPEMLVLTGLAARGTGIAGHYSSVNTLWRTFQSYPNSLIRVDVLEALGYLSGGNPQALVYINQFLTETHNRFRSGIAPDYPVLLAAAGALGRGGDRTSFPVLFTLISAGYPDQVVQEASRAMNAIPYNYAPYLVEVIRKNPPAEKLAAFRFGAYNERLTLAEQGEIAEAALETAFDIRADTPENDAFLSSMRYASIPALARLKWTRSTGLVIKHFYQVQTGYLQGTVSRDRFLEAIRCLGAMGNSEAAQVLALQLGLLNSQTERTGEFDEAIILALVNALGEIGDKIAFDYFLYMGYLSYSESIKNAAREALTRLRW